MKTRKLVELSPGEIFQRCPGGYRYIVSPSRQDRCGNISIYCYNLDGSSPGYWWGGNQIVIPIPCPGTESPPSSPSPFPFYMCYVEGANNPTRKHTYTQGMQEAERLATSTRKRCYLLKCQSFVDFIPPITHTGLKWTKMVM